MRSPYLNARPLEQAKQPKELKNIVEKKGFEFLDAREDGVVGDEAGSSGVDGGRGLHGVGRLQAVLCPELGGDGSDGKLRRNPAKLRISRVPSVGRTYFFLVGFTIRLDQKFRHRDR